MRHIALVLLLTVAALGGASAQEAPVSARTPHTVRGFVYDSITHGPLHGAVVQVMMLGSDLDRAVRLTGMTDIDGRYEIPGVPDGSFMIGFFHAKLDSLGIEAPVRRGTTASGADRAIDLSIPSPATVVASSCGARAVRDSSGLVAGYVLRPENGGTRESAQVLARWSEIIIDKTGARGTTREVTAMTGPTGWFGLCGVPHNALVLLRVTSEADTGSFVEVE
ncbi:MAG: carboxypeptidase-like regulatory domain-containing protein, partial [Gemmatimonadaceae bacterium]